MNVVMTGDGAFVEVQGTAEADPFDRAHARRAARPCRRGLRRADRGSSGRARLVSQVFLASRNPKKLDELRRMLAQVDPGHRGARARRRAAYDEPAETEPTFEGNALIKARAGLQATGLPSLADDSGLCVDALNGMPGVLSARWAGVAKDDAANNGSCSSSSPTCPTSDAARSSVVRWRSACPTAARTSCSARCAGTIIREQRETADSATTWCSCPTATPAPVPSCRADEKDAISHRGKSLRAVAPLVAAALASPRAAPSHQCTESCTRLAWVRAG